jgi:hypothetical protein
LEKATYQGELIHELAAETRKLIEETGKNSLKGEAVVCCTVPKDLLQDFNNRVVYAYYPGGMSQAITDLMRAALQKLGPKAKHPFVEKRHFNIPRSVFILFTLPPGEWTKLKEWRDKDEQVYALTCDRASGEVFLINSTRLDRLQVKKLKGTQESCPTS